MRRVEEAAMTWQVYRIMLRLHTPLHVGWGKVNYLQRTRPYVTGRVLRGALVSRVARNHNEIGDDPGDPYRKVSKTFAQYLTFTYFYPALKTGNDYQVEFPWKDEANFRRRFLSSYAATALSYPQQSAAEGLLHEIEFISPYTLDTGEPVYLMGYVFVEEQRLKAEKYDWRSGFNRLQLGGERGYGWGEVRLESQPVPADGAIFDLDKITLNLNALRPALHLGERQPLLAHTFAQDASVAGRIEPMVGREWRANRGKHIGQHLAFDQVCFAPGSVTLQPAVFIIGEGGYWRLDSLQEGAPR
jgi:hypothetical protein